ncbi:MAG TPA: 50S ribosomal protein L31e, partial [Nitrososphaeraceae archaeon]|nr:50S ribosomal protein L31e [Nitrososphaeraceae archaeon]
MSTSAEESVSRIYTINFGKALLTPRYRRTDRVVNMIREFARKHMKTDEVKLDQELNRHVWKKGKANPPRRLRVRMMKDEDGIVIVSPYEEPTKKSERTATG